MSADTLLYIDVPYEEHMRHCTPDSVLLKKKHWHEHINFYSPNFLRTVVERCDLQVVDENILAVAGGEKDITMLQIICKRK